MTSGIALKTLMCRQKKASYQAKNHYFWPKHCGIKHMGDGKNDNSKCFLWYFTSNRYFNNFFLFWKRGGGFAESKGGKRSIKAQIQSTGIVEPRNRLEI